MNTNRIDKYSLYIILHKGEFTMEIITCRGPMNQCIEFGKYATGEDDFKFSKERRSDKDLIAMIKSECPTITLRGRPTGFSMFKIVNIPDDASDFDIIEHDDISLDMIGYEYEYELGIDILIYAKDGKVYYMEC